MRPSTPATEEDLLLPMNRLNMNTHEPTIPVDYLPQMLGLRFNQSDCDYFGWKIVWRSIAEPSASVQHSIAMV